MRSGIRVATLSTPKSLRESLVEDALEGLTSETKKLPPKYFYDARGSELFERITRTEEYYPTRAEMEILESVAEQVMRIVRPAELVEVGSGSSRKTRLLIDAMRAFGGRRYVPFDVSEDALRDAAEVLRGDYPWLEIHGVVGDFESADLECIPRVGRRLLAFLGSTIGNFTVEERDRFLGRMRAMTTDGDGILLGLDLVKERSVLEAAYDDAEGVTAEFNKNVLHVLNRELDGDLPVDDFVHEATWNEEEERVEMRLRATREIRATLRAIDLEVRFAAGEALLTEYSHKFRRERVVRAFADADLRLARWYTDSGGRFAVAFVQPA